MKLTPWAVIVVALLAVAATATEDAAAKALTPGQIIADFQFVDLTGPNRGRQLSQVEAFGASPVVLALVNESPHRSRDLVAGLQKLSNAKKAAGLRVFVAFVAGPETKEAISEVAREKNVSIPVGYVSNRREVAPFGINAAARNTVVVYRNRKVQSVLLDVEGVGVLDVVKAADRVLSERDAADNS